MAEYLGKGIDINSYTENYLRLHLLEVKGGTPVLRSLFLNIVSNSPAKGDADKYLSYFKCDIQRHKHGSVELKVLFPSNGCTNIDKWDVSLLAYVLIHCCTLEGQLSLKGKPNPRELLKKEIEKKGDLSSFLIDNKKELEKLLITSKITQQQYETLYSQDLPTVDFAAWDVELVLHVLFKVCSDTRLLKKVRGACMDVVNRHVKLFSSNIVLGDFLKEYQHIFDEFKKEQKLDDTQYKQIFPNTNASDATQWKSEVLICVVVNTCKYLSQLACNGVKTVRHMRKELGAHTAETNINNDDFLKKWTFLYGAIHNIATEIPETQNNVEVVIRDLLRGPLDIQNSVKYLQQCYANQDTKYDKILEILTAIESNLSITTVITRQLEEIIEKQNELMKEIIKQQIKVKEEIIEQQKKEKEEIIEQHNKLKEDMMLNLEELLRRLPEQNLSAKRDSKGFAVVVDVSGDDINAVENAHSSILRAANGCEDNDIQPVKMHTDEIKELLSQDGNEISEAKKRSIILVVKCSSLHEVHSMLRTLNSNELKDRLCQLQKVLSEINKCPIRLGIDLSDSSIKKITGMIEELNPQSGATKEGKTWVYSEQDDNSDSDTDKSKS